MYKVLSNRQLQRPGRGRGHKAPQGWDVGLPAPGDPARRPPDRQRHQVHRSNGAPEEAAGGVPKAGRFPTWTWAQKLLRMILLHEMYIIRIGNVNKLHTLKLKCCSEIN